MQQILWFEVFLKAAAGLTLLLMPITAVRIVGMERPTSGFWPRVVGAIILGIALAVLISLMLPNARGGLGPAGLIPINLIGAAALIIPLVMGTAAPTKRGRGFLIVNALTLIALAFLEIAHA